MTRHLPTAVTLAAAVLLTAACATAPATPAATATVGTTTHSVVTSSAPATTSTLIQVANWWEGGGQAQTTKLTADMSAIVAADSTPTAMGAACSAFSTDVTAAQSYAAIPDAEAQQHWSAALDHFQQAATDCVAATSTLNTDLMNRTTAEITAGSNELSLATARIQAITATSG